MKEAIKKINGQRAVGTRGGGWYFGWRRAVLLVLLLHGNAAVLYSGLKKMTWE